MPKRPTQGPVTEAEAAWLFRALDAVRPPLVLAVSGGPDSTALMWLAARWRDGLKEPQKLLAVTIDHGLRKESAREAKAVGKLAARLNVEHRTLRWTGRKPKTGIQEAARNARYRLLSQAVREAGAQAQYLLTAHTLDDQAETVLFRMARGSGLAGLAGMGRRGDVPVAEGKGIHLIRPLLDVPKARLIATLKAAKVPYVNDPSNTDPRFTRPRLRKLMTKLAEEGLTVERLAKLATRAQRVEDSLFQALNDAQIAVAPGHWPDEGPVGIDPEAFKNLQDEIGLRLLARIIGWVGNEGTAELAQLERLFDEVTQAIESTLWDPVKAGLFRRTLAGALITVADGKFTLERAPARGGSKKVPEKLRITLLAESFTKPC